jgi:hypothetical protein
MTNGGYQDQTYTTTMPLTANANGYSANETLDQKWDNYYAPNSPYNSSGENDQTNPASGSTDLSSLIPSTSGWQWFAGASNATGYTFSGGASESASLTETATYQSNANGPTLIVNSFNSNYQSSISAHTVDDEPETPASPGGTDTFHRDETYGGGVTVTGNGSYGPGPGQTNATYQAVQTAQFNVGGDNETDKNETATGTDANGNPYTQTYNWTGQLSGNGSFSLTENYQDVGNGLALTSETFQAASASGQGNDQLTGSTNDQSFNMSATVPESWSGSAFTVSGSTTPIGSPVGLLGTFPLWDTVLPNDASYQTPAAFPGAFLQVSPRVANLFKNGVQGWYNHAISGVGENAKKKSAKMYAQRELMAQMGVNGGRAGGQFTLDSTGRIWAQTMGEAKSLSKKQENILALYNNVKAMPSWNGTATEGVVDVVITYAIDGADKNPRSGDAVLVYKYIQHITGTKNGVPTEVTEIIGGGSIKVHDDNLINRILLQP